ncbi:MAG: nucleotide exchange factor GrpE [Clostridia bacterium]|nr:nucleotide exchange factor GrpE [Clostridia bacterium]
MQDKDKQVGEEPVEATVEETAAPETAAADTPEAEPKKKDKEWKKEARRLETELIEANKKLEEAQSALAAETDKYMHMIAEYDNFRRRTAKEREGLYADAYADLLTKILPVLDNLERAAQYNDAATVAQGVSMTCKSFIEVLTGMGITEIEALGKPFDPNLHNAVMHIDDAQYGESEVVEVLQKGYIRGDRVLRYAMVKVAN